DAEGRRAEVEVIAGDYAPADAEAQGAIALQPPRHSWAAEPDADVALWIVRLDPGARLSPPAASGPTRGARYQTAGRAIVVGSSRFGRRVMVEVRADQRAPLSNDSSEANEVLGLQGSRIGEPVAARGPFVMNAQEELIRAIR